MKNSFNPLNLSKAVPSVRQVTPAHIISWLSAGWRDVRANPVPSIAYGLLFGIGGDLILLASIGRPHLFAVAVSGFFLTFSRASFGATTGTVSMVLATAISSSAVKVRW
jgi:hypothetical protein